ncbi:sensor histidine kinase [Pseudodesulfovibrio cashew]|nr:ATP-binding protein [Pseudodesulfovibrio cashew]
MDKATLFRKIHRLLFSSMLLVPAVPLILSAALGFYFFADTARRSAVSAISRVAVDHKKLIHAFLRERQSDLEAVLNRIPAELLTENTSKKTLQAMLPGDGGVFKDAGLIAPSGKQAAYNGPYALAGRDYATAEWYRETLKNGYFVSDVFLGYRNIPHLVVAVARRVGSQAWVLRATIDSDVFGAMVDDVSIGDSGEAYIINTEGRFQTRRRSGGALLERDTKHYPTQSGGLMTFTGQDGENSYLYASNLLNDGKWRLIVRQKEEEAFHSTALAAYTVLLVLLCGGGVILVLAFVVSRKLSDTLHEQAETVGKLEAQLLQAARLAELGEMAAGFAHEINNPLQIMKTELALLELTVRDIGEGKGDEASFTELNEIAEQLQLQISRCAAITREILRFGRQDAPQLQPIDLAGYLPKVGAMVENKATVHGIDLRCEVDAATPMVEADPGQLQQVMINLLNNAIHAVVDRHGASGGVISVAAGRDERDNAVITVTDNGSGMSRESMSKIFLPFFTTKAPGKGTGLGLSVCHSIIDSLGGELSVESRKGEGSTFTILIPGLRTRTAEG